MFNAGKTDLRLVGELLGVAINDLAKIRREALLDIVQAAFKDENWKHCLWACESLLSSENMGVSDFEIRSVSWTKRKVLEYLAAEKML